MTNMIFLMKKEKQVIIQVMYGTKTLRNDAISVVHIKGKFVFIGVAARRKESEMNRHRESLCLKGRKKKGRKNDNT